MSNIWGCFMKTCVNNAGLVFCSSDIHQDDKSSTDAGCKSPDLPVSMIYCFPYFRKKLSNLHASWPDIKHMVVTAIHLLLCQPQLTLKPCPNKYELSFIYIYIDIYRKPCSCTKQKIIFLLRLADCTAVNDPNFIRRESSPYNRFQSLVARFNIDPRRLLWWIPYRGLMLDASIETR